MTYYRKNLTGHQFGSLIVLAIVPAPTHVKDQGSSYFSCQCIFKNIDGNICGKIKIIKGTALTNGSTRSCGCSYNLEVFTTKESCQLKSLTAIFNDRYLDGNLKFNEFKILCNLPCFYCGIDSFNSNEYNYFSRKKQNSDFSIINGLVKYNGIDRVINSISHNQNNSIPCCKTCNSFKLTNTYESMLFRISQLEFNKNDLNNQYEIRNLIKLIEEKKITKINKRGITIIGKISRKLSVDSYRKIYRDNGMNFNNLRKFNSKIELSQIDVAELIAGTCSYCGFMADWENNILIGVDRLDNKIGYTIENSVSACVQCNKAKNDMELDKFLEWIKRIKNNLPNLPKSSSNIKYAEFYI